MTTPYKRWRELDLTMSPEALRAAGYTGEFTDCELEFKEVEMHYVLHRAMPYDRDVYEDADGKGWYAEVAMNGDWKKDERCWDWAAVPEEVRERMFEEWRRVR